MSDSPSSIPQVPVAPLAEAVRELLRERGPSFLASDPLPDGLRLDESGVGLDSVALVELIVACERRFAVRLPATLLRGEPPTVGDLVAWLRAAGA